MPYFYRDTAMIGAFAFIVAVVMYIVGGDIAGISPSYAAAIAPSISTF